MLIRQDRLATSAPKTPLAAAVLAMLLFSACIGFSIFGGMSPRDFILIGHRFITQSHASAIIKFDPSYRGYRYRNDGYDGEFSYFIALDPVNARRYMDGPYPAAGASYRYNRILYPLLARLTALARPTLVPWTLLAINVLAVGLTVWALAAFLAGVGASCWYAILYALYPGTVYGVTRDLTDPLALALLTLAVYVCRREGREQLLTGAFLLALAGLTRETVLVVAPAYVAWVAWSRGASRAAAFALISVAPFALWKLFLWHWMGSIGLPPRTNPVPPFTGLFHQPEGNLVAEVAFVVVPALLCAAASIQALLQKRAVPEAAACLINVLLYVVLLNHLSFTDTVHSSRIAAVVPLFALFVHGSARGRRGAAWLKVCAVLWLAGLAAPLLGDSTPGFSRPLLVGAELLGLGSAILGIAWVTTNILRRAARAARIRGLRFSAS